MAERKNNLIQINILYIYKKPTTEEMICYNHPFKLNNTAINKLKKTFSNTGNILF